MTPKELRVRFTQDGLCVQSTGRMLAADRIFVRCPRPPPEGTPLQMSVYLSETAAERMSGTVRRAVASGKDRGFEAVLEGTGAGDETIEPVAEAPAPAPPRIRARIENERDFVIQHARGLGNGVLFVPMQSPPAVGTMVELHLELPDGGPAATCDALVLKLVAQGREAGAQLKCLGADTKFHRRIEAYFARLAESRET